VEKQLEKIKQMVCPVSDISLTIDLQIGQVQLKKTLDIKKGRARPCPAFWGNFSTSISLMGSGC
jgi:hypothetical protein